MYEIIHCSYMKAGKKKPDQEGLEVNNTSASGKFEITAVIRAETSAVLPTFAHLCKCQPNEKDK